MSDGEGEGAANAVSKAVLEELMAEDRECRERKASLQSAYMTSCKPIAEDRKDITTRAKEAGIPKKVWARLKTADELEQKKERLAEGLDEDQEDQFDDLRLKLGMLADTPLGNAAESGKVTKRKPKPDALNSLVN